MNRALLVNRWADALVFADETGAGRVRPWHRTGPLGELVRLRRGVYLERAKWDAADAEERLRWRLRAAAADSREHLVFSHLSAAVLWDLPLVAPAPALPHVLQRRDGGPLPSPKQLRRTTVGDSFAVESRDGLFVTSLARTVIDVARTEPLSVALPVVDAALAASVGRQSLEAELDIATRRGRAMARTAVALGDPLSGSPGESVSRAAVHVAGFPPPELQKVFRDVQGRMIVDFWWPEANLVGEFDGAGKYLRAEYLRGRTPGDTVVAEKWREDRLRALGPRVTRWGWELAWNVPALRRHLTLAGLVAQRLP